MNKNDLIISPDELQMVMEYRKQMKAMSYDAENPGSTSLDDRGFYFFFDEVHMASASDLIQWILEQNLKTENTPEFLTIVINSPGGDVNSAFAVIDTIKGSTIPVRTIGLGLIASCGLMMFISGEKGHRILTPNTSILSHQYTWASWGKQHELYAVRKEQDLTTDRIVNLYKKCTGLPDKKIKEVLLPPHDVWLSASEAQKLGLCDEIKETY